MAKKKSLFVIIGLIAIVAFIVIFINYNRFEHFTLSKEPDGIFSSPYTNKLAVVTDGQLTIYNEFCEARKIDTDFNIKYVYPLDDTAWVVDVDGNLYELTYRVASRITISDVILTNIKKVVCSPISYAAISMDGELYVWGDSEYCQLGISDKEYIETPTRVTDVDNIIDYASYYTSAILLTDDGRVYKYVNWDQSSDVENEIENSYVYKFIEIENLSEAKYIYGDYDTIVGYNDNKISGLGSGEITAEGKLSINIDDSKTSKYNKIGLYTFSSGAHYQLGMTVDGDVYYWGLDILTEPDCKCEPYVFSPKKVKGIKKADMIYAGCGVGYVKKGLKIYILKR